MRPGGAAPWLCPASAGSYRYGAGLWARDAAGALECMRRVCREVDDPCLVRRLVGDLLDMHALFVAGEACAPYTGALWSYRPSALELVEDGAQG